MKNILNIGVFLWFLLISISSQGQVISLNDENENLKISASKSKNAFKEIKISPNPSVHVFNVDTDEELIVKVYDHLGQVVEQFKTNSGQKHFGEDLLPGVYNVNFLQGEKVIKRMNVTKNW